MVALKKIFEAKIGIGSPVNEAKNDDVPFRAELDGLLDKSGRPGKTGTITADERKRRDMLKAIASWVTDAPQAKSNMKPRSGPCLHFSKSEGSGIWLMKRSGKIVVEKHSDTPNSKDKQFDKQFADSKDGWMEAAEYFYSIA